MKTLRAHAVVGVWLLGLLYSSVTSAQSTDSAARAAELSQEAAERFNDGDGWGAIALFHQAMDLVPDPAFAFNLAQLYNALGVQPQAAQYFRFYLELHPEAGNREDIESRIDALNEEMPRECAQLVVRTDPAGAQVTVRTHDWDHDYGETPVDFFVAPGPFSVTAELPGYESVTRESTAEAGVPVELDLGDMVAHDVPSDANIGQIVGWSLVGLGAVGVTVGALSWAESQSKSDDYNALVDQIESRGPPVDPNDLRTLEDEANSAVFRGNLLFGIGVSVLVGGVAVLLLSAGDDLEIDDTSVGVAPITGGWGIAWGGTF